MLAHLRYTVPRASLLRRYATITQTPSETVSGTNAVEVENVGSTSTSIVEQAPNDTEVAVVNQSEVKDQDPSPVSAERAEPHGGPALRSHWGVGSKTKHGLYHFFRQKTENDVVTYEILEPSDQPNHGSGRAWSMAELRRKSFRDLHVLWYVLVRERNLIATSLSEARRIGILKQFVGDTKEKDRMCRDSMARIKLVLNERRLAYEGAVQLLQHEVDIDEEQVRLTRIQRKRRQWREAVTRSREEEQERRRLQAEAEAQELEWTLQEAQRKETEEAEALALAAREAQEADAESAALAEAEAARTGLLMTPQVRQSEKSSTGMVQSPEATPSNSTVPPPASRLTRRQLSDQRAKQRAAYQELMEQKSLADKTAGARFAAASIVSDGNRTPQSSSPR